MLPRAARFSWSPVSQLSLFVLTGRKARLYIRRGLRHGLRRRFGGQARSLTGLVLIETPGVAG